MANTIIDIDKRIKDFRPVQIRFRGKVYKLGGTATALMATSAVLEKMDAKEDEDEVALALRMLPPVLEASCPELGKALKRKALTDEETLALLPVLTEVVTSMGSIRFS